MKTTSFFSRQKLAQWDVAAPSHSLSLDNIRLASPCPASWAAMPGDDRVRHCAECKLDVYNLSAMTRAEAERFVLRSEGRLCVRFYRRADGTVLTRNCPVGLQAVVRRVSRIAGAALTAMMSLGAAFAQSSAKGGTQIGTSQAAQNPVRMDLTVTDPQGAVVSGAAVCLLDKRGKKQFRGVTDNTGIVLVSAPSLGSYLLRIEVQGFKTYKKTIDLKNDASNVLRVALSVKGSGTVVEVGGVGPSLVDTESATVQTVFSGQLLEHRPH